MKEQYIGRFAPSPTGKIHFGTLVAAVASYLQAKTNDGKWLLRMEDVDTLRNVPGSDTAILTTLESFGFEWDGEVLYQTARNALYEEALERLMQSDKVFPCTCSRRQLRMITDERDVSIYPGLCRSRSFPFNEEHAIRVRTDDTVIRFRDRVMGPQREDLARDCGDFIIKRRDGLFAYQLAVVVDDAEQGVTEVVRGADLLCSTARQIYLQNILGYENPDYFHIPLALGIDGDKLSKMTSATPLDDSDPTPSLFAALSHLGQKPAEDLRTSTPEEIWQWAIENWNADIIPKEDRIME